MEKTTIETNGVTLPETSSKAKARDAAEGKALSSLIASKVRAVTDGLAKAGQDKALQDRAALKVACRLAFEKASE